MVQPSLPKIHPLIQVNLRTQISDFSDNLILDPATKLELMGETKPTHRATIIGWINFGAEHFVNLIKIDLKVNRKHLRN